MPGGKRSRDKGLRIEREIVLMHELLNPPVHAERVPLSGGTMYRGNSCDVDVYCFGRHAAPLVAEVKARASGGGFTLLERWLSDADMLFLRRNRAQPLIVMPWPTWAKLLAR